MIFRNLDFDSNLIMNPRVLILIYFYSSSHEQTFLSTQLLAKFVSRPINPLTRIQSSRTSFSSKLARLPPPLFLFPPPSPTRISRRCLSPTLEFPTFSPRMNVMRNDSTQALYTSKHTSHRIRIVTMIRKRSA